MSALFHFFFFSWFVSSLFLFLMKPRITLAPFSVSSCYKFKHKWPLVLRMTRHQSVNLPLNLQGHHYWLLKQLLEKQALTWGEPCSINPTLPHLYNYSIIQKKKKKRKVLVICWSFPSYIPKNFSYRWISGFYELACQ